MILFFFDQIASAQYVAPILKKWLGENRVDWSVLATSKSAKYLRETNIPFKLFDGLSESELENYLKLMSPNKALLSTSIPNLNEQRILRFLKMHKIPTAQLIDHWINLLRRFEYYDPSGSKSTLLPDYICVLDEYSKNALVAYQIPENIIQVIGQPYWEHCWRINRDRAITVSTEKVGLAITQPISQFFGGDLGYDQFSFLRCCLDAWESAGFNSHNLHILVHPSESVLDYSELRIENYQKPCFIDGKNISLKNYNFVMGMSSSMLAMSLLEGALTISVQPNAIGEDACTLSRREFIPRITSKDMLTDLFKRNAPLVNSSNDSMKQNKLIKLVDGSLERLELFLNQMKVMSI